MILRQIGAVLLAAFIFFASIAAMSRLLTTTETPGLIDNFTKGVANLYNGAFQQ